MGNKSYLSQSMDLDLLQFLWRWKIATTAGLTKRFFSRTSGYAAYRRLWRLEKAGFIQSYVEPRGKCHYWTLTNKGYANIRRYLPDLSQEGFRSENPAHDLLVSAIHLGDRLVGDIAGLEFFTEQQIRRYHPDFYPAWVPKNTLHVPDGYWHVLWGKGCTIALEVELSRKRLLEYEKIAGFYESHPSITTILWVVARDTLVNPIQQAIQDATDGVSNHNFVLAWDVLEKGWQAVVAHGPDRSKSINSLLGNSGTTAGHPVDSGLSLDTRKSPYKSIRPKEAILRQFADWVGLSPNFRPPSPNPPFLTKEKSHAPIQSETRKHSPIPSHHSAV